MYTTKTTIILTIDGDYIVSGNTDIESSSPSEEKLLRTNLIHRVEAIMASLSTAFTTIAALSKEMDPDFDAGKLLMEFYEKVLEELHAHTSVRVTTGKNEKDTDKN